MLNSYSYHLDAFLTQYESKKSIKVLILDKEKEDIEYIKKLLLFQFNTFYYRINFNLKKLMKAANITNRKLIIRYIFKIVINGSLIFLMLIYYLNLELWGLHSFYRQVVMVVFLTFFYLI